MVCAGPVALAYYVDSGHSDVRPGAARVHDDISTHSNSYALYLACRIQQSEGRREGQTLVLARLIWPSWLRQPDQAVSKIA